jgi:hypothetical protein
MMLSRRAVPTLRRLVHPTRRLLHASTIVSSQRLDGVPSLEEGLQAETDSDSGFLQGEVRDNDIPGPRIALPQTHIQHTTNTTLFVFSFYI